MTESTHPTDAVRLSKRVAQQFQCSRTTAEQYIEGGWVSVDGQVVELPGARVASAQSVVLAPDANLMELTPVTLLLHKPPGYEAGLGLVTGATHGAPGAHGSRSQGAPQAVALLNAQSHLPEDAAGTRVLLRHFKQLECFTPLPTEASGLVVYTQDRRVARKLQEDIETLEQECIVEVAGQIADGGLQKLCHGLQRPAAAAHQGQLAKRDTPALRAQGHPTRPDPGHVRSRGPVRADHQAHPHRPRAPGQGARGAVALPAAVGAVLNGRGPQRPERTAMTATRVALRRRGRARPPSAQPGPPTRFSGAGA